MLDPHGFVATCNSTHFFIVRKGEVWTSSGKYCLGGITRGRGAGNLPRGRNPGHRKGFLADRRLWRGRGVRDRHLRRHRPGARGRRTRVLECRGPMVERLQQLYRERVERTWRSSSVRDHPHRHVVGPEEPVHGDDAQLRKPRSDTFVSDEPFYGCFLKDTRRPTPDARRGDRGDGLRLAQRRSAAGRARARRRADLVPEAYVAPHGRAGRLRGFRRLHPCLPDPRARADDRCPILRKREAAAFEDFGLERQAEFFEREADRLGHAPPVIDSERRAGRSGRHAVERLCEALGIPWDPAMLAWEPGMPGDGRPLGAALV